MLTRDFVAWKYGNHIVLDFAAYNGRGKKCHTPSESQTVVGSMIRPTLYLLCGPLAIKSAQSALDHTLTNPLYLRRISEAAYAVQTHGRVGELVQE